MTTGYTFNTKRALSNLSRIESRINQEGRVTTIQLAAYFGKTPEMVRRYVNQLWETGHIRQNGYIGSAVAWSIGADTSARKSVKAETKPHQPKHARSEFDCALFGKPAAIREAV